MMDQIPQRTDNGSSQGLQEGLENRLVVRVYGFDQGAQRITAPAAYMRFMDRGRLELLEALCREAGEETLLKRYMLNAYRVDAIITGRSHFGDRLEVRTVGHQATTHRTAFDQQVLNADTGEQLVDARVEVLFVDNGGKLLQVPESIAALLGPRPSQERGPLQFPVARADEPYTYSVPFRVYFEDTDAQKTAYHASLARFAEGALVESIFRLLPRKAVLEWLDPERIHLRRLGIRFLRATVLGDHLDVKTRAVHTSAGEIVVEQQILKRETNQVAAQVVWQVGLVDDEGKSLPVPEHLSFLIPYRPEA